MRNLISIDSELFPILLQTVAAAFSAGLNLNEFARCLQERENCVSEKSYEFMKSPKLTGYVDEYEPDSIWLTLEGNSNQEFFGGLIEGYEIAMASALRMDTEKTKLELFQHAVRNLRNPSRSQWNGR